MKKILLPVILVFIILAITVGVTATQASAVIVDDIVNYATPTVDGILDDAYLNSLQVKINPPKYAGVDTGVMATVYALYDDNYVYVFYQVENDTTLLSADDDYIYSHPHPSLNDAVELHIGDDLEEHLPAYTGSNAAHHSFIMDAYGKRFSCYENSIENYVDLMKGVSKITSDTSYNVEMAIPVVNPFSEGDIIQFNFQVNDCQDSEAQSVGYIGLGDIYMQLTDFEIGKKAVEKNTCTVRFTDKSQTEVNKGDTVSIPSITDSDSEYYFAGWMTEGDSTVYYPNDEYIVQSDVTFYPVRSAALVVPFKAVGTEESLSIPVTLLNNWYANSISLFLEYDKNTLELTSVENGNIFDSLENVDTSADTPEINLNSCRSEEGTAFTLNFKVKDSTLLTDNSIKIKLNTSKYPTTSEIYTLRNDTSKTKVNIATEEDATEFIPGYALIDKEIVFIEQGTSVGFINVRRAQHNTDPASHKAGTKIISLQNIMPIKINIPFMAITDNIASGTISDTVTWVIDKNGVLTVSGEGAIPDYGRTSDQAPWYTYRTQITAIVVEDGITSIGNYAFLALANAESLEIAESVKYIGQFVFREIGLTEFTISHDVELAPFALARMDKLTTLTFTEDVKNFKGNVFTAKNAQTITIKAPEGSFAQKYTELFPHKYPSIAALLTLEFEADGTAKAPIVVFESAGDNVFYAIYEKDANTWALEVNGRGTMKNFPYQSEKSLKLGYKLSPMYYVSEKGNLDEQKIKSIKVCDGVTTIGNYAFYKCNKATTLSLTNDITSIGNGAFWACARFTEIVIPESVESIGKHAFNGCLYLKSLTVPNSVKTIGEDILIKCNTDSIKVITENPTALDYFETLYPSTITEELSLRVVGTKNYALNGAEKSQSDTAVNVVTINADGTLGTPFVLTLADCELEAYENATDTLIGLDITTAKIRDAFVPGATEVLGSLRRAEVAVSDDLTEVLIDGTACDLTNLKKLEYGMGTVATNNAFTELSDLKYPHVALVLDHEGDGTVDAIAVDYLKLAKVIRVEDGKCYVTFDVTSETETDYVVSDKFAEGDVFVYAEIDGKIYDEQIITPITSKVGKITVATLTLYEYGDVRYIDGASYLKNSQVISYTADDIAELLNKNARPLDYYIYNNYVVAATVNTPLPVYYPGILLYVEEPTDPVYNAETKEIETYSPAVLLIDGKEMTVNLNPDAAINDKTADDDYVRSLELGSDAVYHNVPVNYTVDETTGLYSLYIISTYLNDARLINYCPEAAVTKAVDGVAYFSHCFLDWETMTNGSHTVDTNLSITDGAAQTLAGYFYGLDTETNKYVKVTDNNTSAVKIATITNIDTANGILYLDGAEFRVNGINAGFADGVVVDDSVKIWGTSDDTVYTYTTFTLETLAELYELAADNLITLTAAVGVYVDENYNVQIAWILVDNYYYVTDAFTKTNDIVSNLTLYAPPGVDAPPVEEPEDSYNLALLLYVEEPSDPVYNEIKHTYEYFYPAVLLIDGVKINVNLNAAKAIDDKAATHEDVRAKEITVDSNGYAIYSYTLVNYTIDRYGAYSLYTTASDFESTVVVPAGSTITPASDTGLYSIDGKTFELNEKSVIYYTYDNTDTEPSNTFKHLGTYTSDNMPTDFDSLTTSQLTYLVKKSNGIYTLIKTFISEKIQ